MGRLFVFMGKSASGKDTLYGELLARYPEIHAVIPYTTRPIREGDAVCGIKVLSDRPWTVVLFHGGRWTD